MSGRHKSHHDQWAHFRFAVLGPLLVSPPKWGELKIKLTDLAEKKYAHPVTQEECSFTFSTIERWYYDVLSTNDPVKKLRRKVRHDAGFHRSITRAISEAIEAQYRAHVQWSYQLHYDNLKAWANKDNTLGKIPTYHTIRRYMKDRGWLRIKRPTDENLKWTEREVRSFEVTHVGALWHLDFHHGSRKVLTPDGIYVTPKLLAIMDDKSRLICHAQWYLSETAETLTHALSQAFLKRGLPRALLTDNGSAMIAAESVQGLQRLSIVHYRTLACSPYQNGKQESFFRPVEGRLLAMLDHEKDLTLQKLNHLTQVWIEQDYHRSIHSELCGSTPLQCWLNEPNVMRESPDWENLMDTFRQEVTRRQRCSDGTISIKNIRFEVPYCYHHLRQLTLRYASWDLRNVTLIDPLRGTKLCQLYPLNRQKNADQIRRRKNPLPSTDTEYSGKSVPAPYLEQLLEEYDLTGLPTGYLPLHGEKSSQESSINRDDPSQKTSDFCDLENPRSDPHYTSKT